MSPVLRNLLVSDILIRFCEQIPYAFVALWAMHRITHAVSAFQFGILTTIEMTTAFLIYVLIAYLADRSGKKPFVLITFGFFTLFPLALLFSQSFGLPAAAFGGAFLWMISPAANFLTAFGFGILGAAWFALRGHSISAKTHPSR